MTYNVFSGTLNHTQSITLRYFRLSQKLKAHQRNLLDSSRIATGGWPSGKPNQQHPCDTGRPLRTPSKLTSIQRFSRHCTNKPTTNVPCLGNPAVSQYSSPTETTLPRPGKYRGKYPAPIRTHHVWLLLAFTAQTTRCQKITKNDYLNPYLQLLDNI